MIGAFLVFWKRKRDVDIAQAELGSPTHRLMTPSRWGSQQKMIQILIEQKRAINQVSKADKETRHLVPSQQDMCARGQ